MRARSCCPKHWLFPRGMMHLIRGANGHLNGGRVTALTLKKETGVERRCRKQCEYTEGGLRGGWGGVGGRWGGAEVGGWLGGLGEGVWGGEGGKYGGRGGGGGFGGGGAGG